MFINFFQIDVTKYLKTEYLQGQPNELVNELLSLHIQSTIFSRFQNIKLRQSSRAFMRLVEIYVTLSKSNIDSLYIGVNFSQHLTENNWFKNSVDIDHVNLFGDPLPYKDKSGSFNFFWVVFGRVITDKYPPTKLGVLDLRHTPSVCHIGTWGIKRGKFLE